MKSFYFLVLAVLFSALSSYAQNTFPATGNVGIGTTAPVQPLDVTGTGGAFNSSAKVNALFVQDHTNYRGIYLGYDNSGQIGIVAPCTNNVSSNLAFWNYKSSVGWFESLRITSDGNVGIGTTSPATNLHVVGTGTNTDGDNAHPLNGGGLVIQGNTGARSAGTGAQLEFAIPANTDGTNIWGQGRIITVAGTAAGNDATGKMIIGTRRSFNKLGTGTQWYYGNDLVIDGAGNIGIGTLTPREALSVNGSIRAKSIKVELANWPDYVFKQDYQLPSLADLKTYINQNQHLPDMPSESDVAKDGINLGEMNKLLLKKVEELTLYLIEKDKQDTEKNKLLQSLQARLSELEKNKSK